jgi:hypothetical protein
VGIVGNPPYRSLKEEVITLTPVVEIRYSDNDETPALGAG